MSDRIFGAVGPKTFPLAIATIPGLSSLAIMVRPDAEPDWPDLGRLAEILAAVVVMVLYAQFLDDLGFVIATSIATAFLTWRLGTRPLQSLVVGVATALGIYVIFHLVLGLSLARGPLGF